MTRIAPDARDLSDRDVIREHYGKIPQCADCMSHEATIWIRGVTVIELEEKQDIMGDLFLCDYCGFHLARIILQDIGHHFPRASEEMK